MLSKPNSTRQLDISVISFVVHTSVLFIIPLFHVCYRVHAYGQSVFYTQTHKRVRIMYIAIGTFIYVLYTVLQARLYRMVEK